MPHLYDASKKQILYVFLTCALFWMSHSIGWAAQKTTTRSTPPTRQIRELSPKHPLFKGVVWSRKAEWSKAKLFFLRVKRLHLLKLPRRDRPLLFLYLGLSYMHLLEKKEGIRALESALLLDECANLPSFLDLSPQIRSLFNRLQRSFIRLCEQKRLNILKKKIKAQISVQAKKPKKKKPTPKVQKSRSVRLAAWLTLGTGTVALGTAFVAGGMALVAEVGRNEAAYTAAGTKEYLRLHQVAGQRALISNVLFVSAGVLLFTGFSLHLSQWIQPHVPLANPTPSSKKGLLFEPM